MITEHDLQEAIAECQGQRNPNAGTCIKLAAYYTIRNEMFNRPIQPQVYSTAPAPEEYHEPIYDGDSEFARLVNKVGTNYALSVMDELMDALSMLLPRLYHNTIEKLEEG